MLKEKNSAGFTLVELLISITIITLILAGAVSLYIYTLKKQPDFFHKSQINLQYRSAFQEFSKMISQATQVESSYGGYFTNSSTVVLKLPAIDQNQQIVANLYDRVVFLGAREIILPASGSSRPAFSRQLIDLPIVVTLIYYKADGTIGGTADQYERISTDFWKQKVINGKTITFRETRYFSLRNH